MLQTIKSFVESDAITAHNQRQISRKKIGIQLRLNKGLINVEVRQTPFKLACHCCYESVRRGWCSWGKRMELVNSLYLAIALNHQSRLSSINHAMLVAPPLQEPLRLYNIATRRNFGNLSESFSGL